MNVISVFKSDFICIKFMRILPLTLQNKKETLGYIKLIV